MEPVRLWRWQGTDEFQAKRPNIDSSTEYAALPRADFDAREARLARAEQERDEAREIAKVWEASAMTAASDRNDADALRAMLLLATARADKAEALLVRMRAATRHRDQNTCDVPHALSREIDAQLAAKGQAAPTPADPTNPAPAATSGAGCTEQKEP